MGRTKNFSEDIEKKAIYNYVVNKQGLGTAGKEFGISQYMMEKILKKYQIPKRTYTEAKQVGRKFPCNDNFFKIQSADMAYILGFLAADGYVSKNENCISMELQAKDKEILDRIAKVTKITRPITVQQRKNGNYTATLRNWSFEWKKDLSHYGIVNKKTFILSPPELLNSKYYIDYIRGYFDGDGSLSITPAVNGKGTTYNKYSFEIVGASKREMDWIYKTLVVNYGIILNKPSHSTTKNGIIMYSMGNFLFDENKKEINNNEHDLDKFLLQAKNK